MKKGRLTHKEHERRLKLLLEFIFIFRYATGYEIAEFSRIVIGITYSRWLVYYASKRGLIRSYYEPRYRVKVYCLTTIGKGFIYEQETLVEHYNFDKKHAGNYGFQKHRALVDAYLNITSHVELNMMNWQSDWMLRIKKRRYESVPYSEFVIRSGIKVALELILERRSREFIKSRIFQTYSYLIEKLQKYDTLLIITLGPASCKGVKKQVSYESSEFCHRYVIFSEPEMLKVGQCIYRDEVRGLNDAFGLVRAESAGTATKRLE